MKTLSRLAASLVLLAGIAGCEPLGDGNTVETLTLVLAPSSLEQGVTVPAAGTDPAYLKMYDCFCSNLAAVATFTDHSATNFVYRATFTSSNPGVVRVMNYGDEFNERCPAAQRFPGMLIPEGVGTATITARFGKLVDTLEVRVMETAPLAGSFVLAPAAPATSGAVVVGSALGSILTGTLDGRERSLDANVLSWTLTPEDENVATVDASGNVRGIGIDGGTARTLSGSFGDNCPVVVSMQVRVGDILGPLSLAREPGLVPGGDNLLAQNTDELLDITAGLDFDNDGAEDGTQAVGNLTVLGFEDPCTLRVYDETVPDSNCSETAATCTSSTPLCADSTATLCPSTLTTACRTVAAAMIPAGSNRIIALGDADVPTQISATYPQVTGDPTVLTAAIDASATTLTVDELSRYPLDPPWYAVIDKDGDREDVRITAIDGTTLTVVRGISGGGVGSAAKAHPAGATFEQRDYRSTTPLGIQGHGSTLTVVDIVDPVQALAALGTLQVDALGTFVDPETNSRQQRISRLNTFLSGSPTLAWRSSDTSVATVGASGLATSRSACGGTVTIRARASTSTNTDDDSFIANSATDDDACLAGDPLCDQVELCIDGLTPTPAGTVCEDGPHDCTP